MRPLKEILGSAEQAKVLIDATDIRVNSGNPVFFQRDYHPKERQKMRELRTELSLRQKRGEKHLTIKDGEIVTAPRKCLSRSAVAITTVDYRLYNRNQAVIIRELTESNSDVPLSEFRSIPNNSRKL